MEKEFIGKKIRELRKAKGYTQSQLAEFVCMHEKHISRVESGKYIPSFDNMLKIFKVLDFDLSKLSDDSACDINQNPAKTKILKIINNATDNELQFYLGILEQCAKSLKNFH